MKTVLITAGTTSIKIDDVRVISTVFTGKTGWEIAKSYADNGYKVVLLIGNHKCKIDFDYSVNLKVICFSLYQELKSLLEQYIKEMNFDIIIHSAAVSDYYLKDPFKGKISSGKSNLILELIPTEKLILLIKNMVSANCCIVKFKLEVDCSKDELIDRAFCSLQESKVDYIVANNFNDIDETKHHAYLISKHKEIFFLSNKRGIIGKLLELT